MYDKFDTLKSDAFRDKEFDKGYQVFSDDKDENEQLNQFDDYQYRQSGHYNSNGTYITDNKDNYSDGYDDYDDYYNAGKLFVGHIDLSKIFTEPFHQTNKDYFGREHINKSHFRFQLLSYFLGIFNMLYHRTYALFFETLIFLDVVQIILRIVFGGSLWLFPYLFVCLVISITTTEFIRYARVKKANKLESKGLSEEEIADKLEPSWNPVFIYIGVAFLLLFLSAILIAISISMLSHQLMM